MKPTVAFLAALAPLFNQVHGDETYACVDSYNAVNDDRCAGTAGKFCVRVKDAGTSYGPDCPEGTNWYDRRVWLGKWIRDDFGHLIACTDHTTGAWACMGDLAE